MEWWVFFIIALVVPMILVPLVSIGIYTVIREIHKKRAYQKKRLNEIETARELELKWRQN